MISNYTILTDTWDKDLIAQVQKLIIDGWEPQGGVARISSWYDNTHRQSVSQAMIKRIKPKSPSARSTGPR